MRCLACDPFQPLIPGAAYPVCAEHRLSDFIAIVPTPGIGALSDLYG